MSDSAPFVLAAATISRDEVFLELLLLQENEHKQKEKVKDVHNTHGIFMELLSPYKVSICENVTPIGMTPAR